MTHTIQQLLRPEVKDLGGFQARRSLPQEARTLVGPFIFFDHLGPAIFPPGQGVDVRPHPHVNLATVTYLFEGALMHRDSLGTVQEIRPGAVNWMTAGRGIVHSERSPCHARDQTAVLHAIQTWVALPDEHEEAEPSFQHYAADDLPEWEAKGVKVKLITGHAYGFSSPVKTFSPTLYLDIQLEAGSRLTIPADYSERAIYSVIGEVYLEGQLLDPHVLAILESTQPVELTATESARCVVVGGEPVGERVKWWNFVSSRPERIRAAKRDWKEGRFDSVPGEEEFIPLPEDLDPPA